MGLEISYRSLYVISLSRTPPILGIAQHTYIWLGREYFIIPQACSVFHSFAEFFLNVTSMTKRPRSPSAPLPPKRSRKPSGFHLARPPPTTSSQPSASSSSSVFMTVSQPDERRATLIAQSRFIASTSGPSTIPSTSANVSEPEITTESAINADAELEPTPEPQVKSKRKRKTKNVVCIPLIFCCYWILTPLQDYLQEWLKFRQTFLDELLRHDGLGDFLGHTQCSSCQKAPGIIKCRDCSNGRMLKCPECVVAAHATLPLHRVEVGLNHMMWK